ncbi:hypothetical protein K450DRAFT_226982 [Umbelopsis ramanniana AG]|uniref:Uncharacterized protein n=1 Tax=Umbelopsis ramanniana AG TaxID=1314678 RepID=A0AAD5EG46_UMBRA|nr:uncharacterized protein K450DRAFT_226982 [Umbelopsis ramanniana AG]KAI8582395.1 hypothetical protein K450DRAFT_226982 [Umbelopsis ramanniana AG]
MVSCRNYWHYVFARMLLWNLVLRALNVMLVFFSSLAIPAAFQSKQMCRSLPNTLGQCLL